MSKLKQEIEEHFSLLTLVVNEIESECSNLIQTILYAKQNSLHPFIITPQQLIIELIKTLPHLKNSISYPLPLVQNNAYKYFNLISIKYYLSSERIVFVISIPLVSQENYFLIPLPVKNSNQNAHVFILPSINYLVLSENRNMYSTFKDLTHCKPLESNKLICENNEPIFLSNSRQICEIMLLTNPKEIPKNCDVRITNSINEIWHKLSNNSSWIYITPKEIDVTLSCNNYPLTNFLLNNVGIITLKENCKLYTSSIIISSDPTV
ncbi:hypothetical protein NQ314_003290 [Rhamnusium bicolor]|uniref:Envelope protein n=1 Tax=Rhamnusium bicolor TaxID=1586634 RepID=A0AAV8ZNK8_9CUCU|nr:hypothetical protein NQ314_003290 [Rhamnusium bicolor]